MPPYSPPVDALYTEVPLSSTLQWSTMFKVIGKEGKVLKAITYQSGADYIWWKQERNVMEICAYSYAALNDAFNRVSDRVGWFEQEQDKNMVIFGTFNDSVYYQARW